MSELDELAQANRKVFHRRPQQSGGLWIAVVAVVLCVVAGGGYWGWRESSRTSDRKLYDQYRARVAHLEAVEYTTGITPEERAEVDDLHRRIAAMKADGVGKD